VRASANTIALICVGLVAVAAVVTLALSSPSVSAPPLTARSSSAVGFAGVVALLRDQEVPVTVGPIVSGDDQGLSVFTPEPRAEGLDPQTFPDGKVLVVLPKWRVAPDRRKRGWVVNAGPLPPDMVAPLLSRLGGQAAVGRQGGVTTSLALDGALLPVRIDALQTLRGKDWRPILTAADGGLVMASPPGRPEIAVLSDPDLINTQGVSRYENAAAGTLVLKRLRGEGLIYFLDTPEPGRPKSASPLPFLFRPPMLAVTLCALATVLLMAGQALVRFGAAAKERRAVALGPEALVDSSAGLVRMARKEHQLAPAYVELTEAAVSRTAGFDRAPATRERLDELGRRRGVTTNLSDLVVDAARAANRGDLIRVARRIHAWRQEMTRDRR
jgi:hypothetical protein